MERILIGTALGLGTGGAKTYVNTLKNELQNLNISVDTVVPDGVKKINKFVLGMKAFGNRDKARIELTKWRVTNSLIKTKKMLQNNNYDLIHCQDILYVNAIANFKLPIILTVHGPMSREAKMQHADSKLFISYLKDQEKKAYKRADHIIAVDTGQKDIIVNDYNIDPDKISVILNSVDVNFFKPITINKNKYNLKKFFLVPRRLVAKNGVSVAIRAFGFLKDLDLNLIIAGDGYERKVLEDLCKDLQLGERVKFLGNVNSNKMVELMNASEGIIIPSVPVDGVIEASSIAALEGLSVGKPVIASNIGGLSEIIINNTTGYLFEAGNYKELAQILRYIYLNNEKAKKIGNNARKYIENNFSSKIWINKVIDTYKKLS